jgi:hypothetical protein
VEIASPTESSVPLVAIAAAETPTFEVAAATAAADPALRADDAASGGLPAPVLYALAALVAFVAVAGGGWVLATRAGRR